MHWESKGQNWILKHNKTILGTLYYSGAQPPLTNWWVFKDTKDIQVFTGTGIGVMKNRAELWVLTNKLAA